jgi:hypothetical protein
VVHKIKDSLKNNDCFYFIKNIFSDYIINFFLHFMCFFVIFIFLNSIENPQQCVGIQLVNYGRGLPRQPSRVRLVNAALLPADDTSMRQRKIFYRNPES